MGLISRSRKQNAIYWPPATQDDYGRMRYGALEELVLDGSNYRVRWEDKSEEFLDAQDTVQTSDAVVYVPLLPSGNEVEVGGFLWLGDRADLTDEATPTNNPAAHRVRRLDKLPDLKAREFLRTAYL